MYIVPQAKFFYLLLFKQLTLDVPKTSLKSYLVIDRTAQLDSTINQLESHQCGKRVAPVKVQGFLCCSVESVLINYQYV